jgi:hypothetical protein
MKQHWQDAATAYAQSYMTTAYHHDLAPNVKLDRAWGNIVYPWRTGRYGFKIGDCAPGEAVQAGLRPLRQIAIQHVDWAGTRARPLDP